MTRTPGRLGHSRPARGSPISGWRSRSAGAAWPWSTAPGTCSWTARWHSRSSTRRWPRTPASRSGSSASSGPPRRWTIRTSSRCSPRARPTACCSSPCGTWPAPMSGPWWTPRARCRPGGRPRILAQVASALDAAHARGLVHRDVKPANMLLDAGHPGERADHVYLSDFGLSKPALAALGLTAAGQLVGTLDYVAPEQIENRPVDGRADLYALACAGYEMLAGAPPFRRDQRFALLWAQLSEPVPPLTAIRGDLPPAVDGVMARALAKSPADRYQRCGDFVAALREACQAAPGHAGPQDAVAAAGMAAAGMAPPAAAEDALAQPAGGPPVPWTVTEPGTTGPGAATGPGTTGPGAATGPGAMTAAGPGTGRPLTASQDSPDAGPPVPPTDPGGWIKPPSFPGQPWGGSRRGHRAASRPGARRRGTAAWRRGTAAWRPGGRRRGLPQLVELTDDGDPGRPPDPGRGRHRPGYHPRQPPGRADGARLRHRARIRPPAGRGASAFRHAGRHAVRGRGDRPGPLVLRVHRGRPLDRGAPLRRRPRPGPGAVHRAARGHAGRGHHPRWALPAGRDGQRRRRDQRGPRRAGPPGRRARLPHQSRRCRRGRGHAVQEWRLRLRHPAAHRHHGRVRPAGGTQQRAA